MADKQKKPVDPILAAEIAQRDYNKSQNNPYYWADELINELRQRGFTPTQQKNILYHVMAESGGNYRRVQGDYKKDYKGDFGDDWETGRGLVQMTGYSYQAVGQRLGIPLGKNPRLATNPEYAAKIAAEYYSWKRDENPKLNFDNPEDVHKATGPAENWTSRVNRLSNGKEPVRFPTDEDVGFNTPAYDDKKFKEKEDGTLEPVQEDLVGKIKYFSNTGKNGVNPNTTPTSR